MCVHNVGKGVGQGRGWGSLYPTAGNVVIANLH